MKLRLLPLAFLCSLISLAAQVGIGTDAPRGILDIHSLDRGLVVPRVSSVNDVSDGSGNAAVDGTIVYDTLRKALLVRMDGMWFSLSLKDGEPALGKLGDNPLNGRYSYLKASNTGQGDNFGHALSLSADGTTLAVGVPMEDSDATGINGNQQNNLAAESGAVYVFVKADNTWSQQAYLKASNAQSGDRFGQSVSLSGDGSTLVVGASWESSNAAGINGDQNNNSAPGAGAAYLFQRTDTTWTQEAYLKASNTGFADNFGHCVALSQNGTTLAVGAPGERSGATGINGNQNDDSRSSSGATYVFQKSGSSWSQQAYLKASNTDQSDQFGHALGISQDGNMLAVAALREGSSATGINGLEFLNNAPSSGAAYAFTRTDSTWSQQAYIKASNTGSNDFFGQSLSLSSDGNTLLVGAHAEDSNATGINGLETDNSASSSGAAYLFVRQDSTWSQQAYVKASTNGQGDEFGWSVALSCDGQSFVVGARYEDSDSPGINGDESADVIGNSGAAYLFKKSGDTWFQETFIKASNPGPSDNFGHAVALSEDGSRCAVGAPGEDSVATGVNGDQNDNAATASGALYVVE